MPAAADPQPRLDPARLAELKRHFADPSAAMDDEHDLTDQLDMDAEQQRDADGEA